MKRILVPLATMLALVAPTPAHAAKPVKTIQFSTAGFFANETDVGAVVTLTRTWSSGTATVRVSTVSGGTASSSTDYSGFTNRLVSFARGVTTVNTSVALVDDGVYDESTPETANLALSSPSKGAALGSPSTATVTITDDDPPGAPVVTAQTGTTAGSIDLSWAAVPGANNYNLFRGTTSGAYPDGPFPTGGATTATDSGLTAGTTYYYVVESVGANGSSSDSNEASAVAAGSPPSPTELIENGDFETEDYTGWSIGTTNFDTFDCGSGTDACYPAPANPWISDNPHGGQFAAFLGNTWLLSIEPYADAFMSQTFDVPATGTTTLSFWVRYETNDVSIIYDSVNAFLVDTDTDTVVATPLYDLNDVAWTEKTADLTAFAGKTLKLVFLVHQDGASDATGMYVDDVSVINTP